MGKDGFRCFTHCSLLISFHSLSMKSIIICFDLKCYQLSVFPLVHCTVKAVSPSILLQPVTNKSTKTWERTILSAAYTGELSLYLVSARTSLKGWVSSRILKAKDVRSFFSWNYEIIPQLQSPQKLSCLQLVFLQDFTLKHAFRIIKSSSLVSFTTGIKVTSPRVVFKPLHQ